jgi:hypothetical protein
MTKRCMTVSRKGTTRNPFGKSKGKRPIGKPMHGCDDNIKTDLKEESLTM